MDKVYIIEDEDDAVLNKVGKKAYNLFKYRLITPTFLILSCDLYDEWKIGSRIFSISHRRILSKVAVFFQSKDFKEIIIR